MLFQIDFPIAAEIHSDAGGRNPRMLPPAGIGALAEATSFHFLGYRIDPIAGQEGVDKFLLLGLDPCPRIGEHIAHGGSADPVNGPEEVGGESTAPREVADQRGLDEFLGVRMEAAVLHCFDVVPGRHFLDLATTPEDLGGLDFHGVSGGVGAHVAGDAVPTGQRGQHPPGGILVGGREVISELVGELDALHHGRV